MANMTYNTAVKLATKNSARAKKKTQKNEEEYRSFLITRFFEFINDKINERIKNGHIPPYTFYAKELAHTPLLGKRSSIKHYPGYRIPSGGRLYYPKYEEVSAVLPDINKILKEKGWKVSKKIFSQQFKITFV